MRLAIIGSGNVGGALGRLWAGNGHEVTFGSRDPSGEGVQAAVSAAGSRARAATVAEAAQGAEVVVLATPWDATQGSVKAAGDLSGKVVLDATNPLQMTESGLELAVGFTTSAGEQVAGWAPGARVVKAFNSTGSGNYAQANFGGQAASMAICGDDEEAKATVAGLAEELGFDVLDAGPLRCARLLEPLAMLWITLAYSQGEGPEIAWKLLRR